MASSGPQRRDAVTSDLESDDSVPNRGRSHREGEPNIPLPDDRDFGVTSFNSPEQVTGHSFSGQVDGTRDCNDGRSPPGVAPVRTRCR